MSTALLLVILIEAFYLNAVLDGVNGKANFLSRVPIDESENTRTDFDRDDIHDSLVKLPGRHYRKLPYTIPFIHFDSGQNNYPSRSNSQHIKIQEAIGPIAVPVRTRKVVGDPSFGQNDQEDGGETRMAEDASSGEEDAQGEIASPYFDRNLSRNVVATAGETAELGCRVIKLGDKTVNWIRLKDLKILTIGTFRYTTDTRVCIHHVSDHQGWDLILSNVKITDSGGYECQISTNPILSFIINLQVTEGGSRNRVSENIQRYPSSNTMTRVRASISGPPIVILHPGDVINITCEVTHSTTVLPVVDWLYKEKIISTGSLPISSVGSKKLPLIIPLVEEQIMSGVHSSRTPENAYQHNGMSVQNFYRSGQTAKRGIDRQRRELKSTCNRRKRQKESTKSSVFNLVVGKANAETEGRYSCKPRGGEGVDVTIKISHEFDTRKVSKAPLNSPSILTYFISISIIIFNISHLSVSTEWCHQTL